MTEPEIPGDAESQNTSLSDRHFLQSTLRERIVEHVFVGETLRRLWQRGMTDVEILRSEFDAGGYDLVLSYKEIVRHIQLKTMRSDRRNQQVNISLRLAEKPSGCVIWIVVDNDLNFLSFLWFGAAPGSKLPDLLRFASARHTKGNAQGVKAERPGLRILPRRAFKALLSMDDVLDHLFGNVDPMRQTEGNT